MSSGTGSNYPAAGVSGENAGINQAFQPFPYPNTTSAANNAYSGIAGDTSPAGQSALTYGGLGAINYGNSLPGTVGPMANQAYQAGLGDYNFLTSQWNAPVNEGQALYNTLAGEAHIP